MTLGSKTSLKCRCFVSFGLAFAAGMNACASGDSEREFASQPADASSSGGSSGVGGAAGNGGEAGAALPPDFGAPCVDASDCSSGLCVEGPDGSVCTTLCSDDCPTDYECVAHDGLSAPNDQLCMPQLARLCRPCEADADCDRSGVTNDPSRCISWGDEGSFCGVNCQNTACPEGYACEDVTVAGGLTERHCVPENDRPCDCRPSWAGQGFETACAVSNTNGSCSGTRGCEASGLSDCNASTPAAETCDGSDNNCNSQIDEGACDDGLACTDDVCDGQGGCESTIQASACLIGSSCYDAGVTNPSGACEVCTPSLSQDSWSVYTGACDDGDVCTGGDTCTDGTCSGTPVQDANEPNETSSAAATLPDASDCNTYPTGSITGTLYGPGDEDWYSYHLSDDLFCFIYPRSSLTVPAGANHDLCVYLTCDDGSTPSVSCTAGSQSTDYGMNGCCSTNAGDNPENVRIDHDCPGSGTDDSSQVYVRIFNAGAVFACDSYTLEYGDD